MASNKNKKLKPNQMLKKMPANSAWFNNVAKSMGFAAADLVKDVMPNTSNFLEYNNVTDSMNMIKDMRMNTGVRNTVSKQLGNIPQVNIAKDALKNALEDIKSGKIWNEERGNSGEFGFDDMDFGFGDAFGEDDSISFDDDGEENVTVNRNTVNNVVNTLPLARAMTANTEATLNAMGSIADQHAAIETEKMLFNNKATTSILGGLSAINDNLTAMVKFQGDATSKYYAASIKYYEESLALIKKANEKAQTSEEKSDVRDDLYTYTGNVKLSNYMQIIKKNLEDIKDESVVLSGAYDAFKDVGNFKAIANNPLGFIAKMSMKSVVPIATKATIQALDASMSSVLPAVLAKLNDMGDNQNPVYQYLNKVFGTKNKLSYSVDLGDYEKGAVAWNGESQKALVEVIPTHLRRIEAALTGKQERIFDYNTGKFEDIKNIKKAYDEALLERETSGYTDAKLKLRSIAQEMTKDKKVLDQFDKDLQEYFAALTKKGSLINPFISEKNGIANDTLAEMGLFDGDTRRVEMVRRAFKGLSQSDLIKMQTMGILDSRKATNDYMNDVRKNPNLSGYSILNNNGYYDSKGKLTYDATKKSGQGDKFGLTSLDYLRDIRKMLATGIVVHPDTRKRYRNNPNAGMVQRIRDEETAHARSISIVHPPSSSGETDIDTEYENILNMPDSELRRIYASKRNEGNGKETKLGSRVLDIPGVSKVSSVISAATKVIDDATYRLVFGEDYDSKNQRIDNLEALKQTVGVKGQGSILSNIMGSLQDTIKGVGSYFTGKSYVTHDGKIVPETDEGLLKKMTGFLGGSIDKLFGAKGDSKDVGMIGKFTENFMQGFKEFKATLFGESKLTDKDRQETLSQLTDKVKGRLPKAIGAGITGAVVKTTLASNMGMLGSIILPGGPLGAAITGMSLSFLSQSDTFKNWLFGSKNGQGQRMGGFIPKSLIEMVEKNGSTIKKGAIIGGGVGLLPSFFLPGGPVTGAILGMGTGLATKSDMFQEFLYGKDFKTKDNKSMMDGAFGKLYKKTIGKANSENPRLAAFLGTAGVGVGLAQGVGLLPSMLLPGGPVVGSLLGLAGGIAASSDKFQQFLFGDKDIDGKRYGGLMTQFSNWFDTTVMSPMKIKTAEINDNIYGFVKGKVINPVIDAFEPLTQAFKFAIDDAKDAMKDTWHRLTDGIIGSFDENVVKPFGESLEKFVVDPMKKIFNNTLSLLGKSLGTLITSPIKLLTTLGNFANYKNERRVMKDERRGRRKELKDAIFGDEFSFGNLGSAIKRQFIGRDEKNQLLNRALPYRAERYQRRQDREDALKQEMEARKAKRDDMQRQYEEDRSFGRSSNWKYASKRQKAAREEELKEKQAWFQEQIAIKEQEAVEKLTAVHGTLERIPSEQVEQRKILEDMADSLRTVVKNLSKIGEEEGGLSGRILSGLGDRLKENNQSHADGLDEVPKDGYIAELHEGEMVVPKKGANVLRNLFSKKKGTGNSLVESISEKLMGTKDKPSIFGKMFGSFMGKEEDHEFNPLNMTRDELETMNEIQDRQRYQYASRKNIDFMQQKLEEKKKEKEERIFRADLLAALEKGFAAGKDATESGNSLLSKILSAGKSLLTGILGKLGIGGALGMAGALATGGFFASKAQQAKENDSTLMEAAHGYGDETRKDKDGYYVYDNTPDVVIREQVRHNAPRAYKLAKSGVKEAKNAYTGAKGVASKLGRSYQNLVHPVSTTGVGQVLDSAGNVVGDVNYGVRGNATSGVGKALAKGEEFLTAGKNRAKDTVKLLVDNGKKAINALFDVISKKIPAAKNITGSLSEVFGKLTSSADEVFKKFGSKIKLYLVDGAADFIPVAGQVAEVGMTVWDIATGLTKGNAANLFQVPQDSVDGEMRLITSAMQGACKFSWFSIVWLLNEICGSMFNIPFLTTVARFFYQSIGGGAGRRIDFSNDLKGVDTKNMSLEDIIQKAGGDLSQFMDKNGKLKDISKLETDKLTGISAVEKQELERLQYNKDNNTNLSQHAYNDMKNKTVGQKIFGSKWAKNLKGSTGLDTTSARNHLGLGKGAKLTLSDRMQYGNTKRMLNVVNFGRKIFGKEEIDDKEVMTSKVYDEKGRYVGAKNGAYSYTDLRNIKEKDKLDKANSKLAELEGKGGWFNSLKTKYYENKRDKAQGRLGEGGAEAAEEARKYGRAKTARNKEEVSKKFQETQERYKKQWEKFKTGAGNTWEGFKTGVGNAKDATINWISDKVTGAKNMVTGARNKIKSGVEWAYEGTEGSDGKKAAQAVKKVVRYADEQVNKGIDNTKQYLNKSIKALSGGFEKLGDNITTVKDDMFKKIQDGYSGFIEGAGDLKDEALKGFKTGIKTVGDAFTDNFNKFKEKADDTKKDIQTKLSDRLKDLGESANKLGESVNGVFTDIKGKLSGFLQKVSEFELPSWETVKQKTVENANNLWEKIKTGGRNMRDFATEIFNAGSAGVSKTTSTPSLTKSSNRESGQFITPSTTNNTTTNNSTNNKFVFYSQNDRQWSNKAIGDKTMADAGCGPTSIAMAISQMTGEQITPDVIANLGKKNLPGYSTYGLFPEIAKKFGMNYEDTENQNDVLSYLRQGLPVILSGRNDGIDTPFTKDGHIVVANRLDGDKVFVSDPRGKGYSKYYNVNTLFNGMRKGIVMKPTNATKNRMNLSKGKLNGVDGQFIGTLNNEISQDFLSRADLSSNLGGDGQIKLYEKVLGYAKAFEKKLKYIYGSKAIDNNKLSSDCSAFTRHVFKRAADIDIGVGSASQHNAGTKVDYNQAQPADVIVFDGHAGIVWDSNKNMIDIGSGVGPVIRSYDSSYWKGRNPMIRRVLTDPNQLVDSNISNPNTALGVTNVAGLYSGGDISGAASTGTSSGSVETVDAMGVFGKMGQIGQNMMASIFNGKQVDLFASSSGTTDSSGGTVDISNMSDVKKAVWSFFTGKGYSKEATAGIMGNMQAESGINPSVIQGNGRGPAAGIAQWENYNKKSDRWADMAAYAKSKGKEWTDLQSQLEFIDMELAGNAPRDNYTATLLKKKVGGIEGFKALTDVGKATDVFESSFERAGIRAINKRIGFANKIYSEMGSAGMGPATATSAQAAPTDGSIPNSLNGWAYYKQGDPRWNNGSIGGSTVAKAGCGPTSHAMMLTTMFGKNITPDTMTKYGLSKGAWSASGMGWNMPTTVAKDFGLKISNTISGKSDSALSQVKQEIKAGRPVIMSGRGQSNNIETPFTTGGHIVLAVGVDGNGNIIINDPRDPKYTKAYTDKGLKLGTGLRQSWAFEMGSGAAIPNGFTTSGDFVGGGATTGASTGGSAETVDALGAFGKMGQIGQNMMASIFNGKQVDLFASSSGANTMATGSGNFPKYNLNDQQIKGIANILEHEQPGPEGMQAEASLMANLTDKHGDDKATVDNLIKQATGGWFAYGKSRFENPGSPSSTAIEAVKSVLVNGRRTVPRYVDEHDCFSDIRSATNDGKGINKSNRGEYKQFVTKIKNVYGSSGTFHSFPNSKSDPFYYTSESLRQKWGENCYPPTVSSSAGMGDGNTYMITPKQSKVSYSGSAGKGESDTNAIAKLKKIRSNVLENLSSTDKGSIKPTNNTMIFNNDSINEACIDVLLSMVDELKAIKSNTAATANNTSKIKVYSENTSVNDIKNTTRKTTDKRQANDNTGYSMARTIAGFMK